MDQRLQQRNADRAEIKIRLIENGILVGAGQGWFTFQTWERASEHIALRLERLEKERQEAAR